jgi:hypothetical protein
MTNDRPTIPRELEREVLMEAGHRCAIPTCKQVPVEIAHIEPYRDVVSHTFGNLIALCPTCHTRYDKGEIDRKSMKLYKAKLSIINNRYGDFERRVLQYFVKNSASSSVEVTNGKESEIHLFYLIKDGLIHKTKVDYPPDASFAGGYKLAFYELTREGRDFIKKWLDPQEEIR